MDETDEKILQILRSEARTPYTEISKVTGLSEGAVRKRIGNLVKSGVIRRFTIDTSIGDVKALILISTAPSTPTHKVAQTVKAVAGVDSVFEVTGEYDISALAYGSDIAEVNRIIDEIRGVEGVQNTRTLFVLRSWL